MDQNLKKGRRYSRQEKMDVINFVDRINEELGRGGISRASREFGISQLTISKWIRDQGEPVPGRRRARGRTRADVPANLERLSVIMKQINELEDKLGDLHEEYDTLKAQL